jgi:hypothetical protein
VAFTINLRALSRSTAALDALRAALRVTRDEHTGDVSVQLLNPYYEARIAMNGLEHQLFLAKKSLFKKSFHLAHAIFTGGGLCLEFGVFHGNSYVYQAQEIATRYQTSRLVGFDSWQGLPDETPSVWRPSIHTKGAYASTKDVVLSKMRKLGLSDDKRFSFVDGFYSDSLTAKLRQRFSNVIFINIDVDIYKSTMELLDFVKPLLRPGVVIYWDDWKDPRASSTASWGEHLAWEHWTRHNNDITASLIEVNWVNQRTMVITEANGKTLTEVNLSIDGIMSESAALDSTYSRITKAVVRNPPVSSLINFGFKLWGKLRPL